jgi:hypothetical protein
MANIPPSNSTSSSPTTTTRSSGPTAGCWSKTTMPERVSPENLPRHAPRLGRVVRAGDLVRLLLARYGIAPAEDS